MKSTVDKCEEEMQKNKEERKEKELHCEKSERSRMKEKEQTSREEEHKEKVLKKVNMQGKEGTKIKRSASECREKMIYEEFKEVRRLSKCSLKMR